MNIARFAKGGYAFLGAAAMVVLVALIEAGFWVAFHGGFGRGDLLALSVWSLPFGAVVATAGLVLRGTEPPKARALRVWVAAAAGGLLGLGWTLLMVQMMGPWFGTFSFPILPILSTSGALTLGVFTGYRPRSVVTPAR